jgi:hypothetical protein
MFNRTLDGDDVIAMPPRPDAACNRREHVGEARRASIKALSIPGTKEFDELKRTSVPLRPSCGD